MNLDLTFLKFTRQLFFFCLFCSVCKSKSDPSHFQNSVKVCLTLIDLEPLIRQGALATRLLLDLGVTDTAGLQTSTDVPTFISLLFSLFILN